MFPLPEKSKIFSLQRLSQALRILLGCMIYAVGFQYFMYHNAIPTGGVAGVAMIINYLTRLPVGVLTIAINIPIFIIGWRRIGFGFMVASAIGMALSSVLVDLCALSSFSVTRDPILACLFSGVLHGFGLGLVYSTGATTGGVDIIAKLLRRKYQYINFGTIILVMDVAIITTFAVIFKKYDSAMYGLVSMFIAARVIDFVLYGAMTSKMCYIITDASQSVRAKILEELQRGVTVIRGVGAWSGTEKEVLLCVVKRQEVVRLRRIVHDSDQQAFLIFTDARDVYGNGFTDLASND